VSKKTNTIIFVIIGTIVNVILAIIFVVALLVITSWAKDFIGNAKSAILPFIVFLGIFISMMVYQRLSAWVIKKFKLEDKLDPLFTSRRRR